MSHPTPLPLVPGFALLSTLRARQPQAAPHSTTEPSWQQAYRRVSARPDEALARPETDAPAPPPELLNTVLPPRPLQPAIEAPAPREATGRVEPGSATAVRMVEAARAVATPPATSALAPRLWQIELPGSAAGWQLQIHQAQPQAPLALALQVPPVMALQAQQQLADLDRRLREGGHELLRSRLRTAARPGDRRRPVDEVGP